MSAPDLDELKRRCDEVKDFYDDLNVKLVRPAGDMPVSYTHLFALNMTPNVDYNGGISLLNR